MQSDMNLLQCKSFTISLYCISPTYHLHEIVMSVRYLNIILVQMINKHPMNAFMGHIHVVSSCMQSNYKINGISSFITVLNICINLNNLLNDNQRTLLSETMTCSFLKFALTTILTGSSIYIVSSKTLDLEHGFKL